MDSPVEVPLIGGNVSHVVRIGDSVRRMPSVASEAIERLLNHPTIADLPWVPDHFGFDDQGRERIQFVPGTVPHGEPDWLWTEHILLQVAAKLREWHDATIGFDRTNTNWNLTTRSPDEVICHNDFAPYNLVFEGEQIVGLIDFDTCAPGPRIWDIAYAAYKIVPLVPLDARSRVKDNSSRLYDAELIGRLDVFLKCYACQDKSLMYSVEHTITTASERLLVLADWTAAAARKTRNSELLSHESMYRLHSSWLKNPMQMTIRWRDRSCQPSNLQVFDDPLNPRRNARSKRLSLVFWTRFRFASPG